MAAAPAGATRTGAAQPWSTTPHRNVRHHNPFTVGQRGQHTAVGGDDHGAALEPARIPQRQPRHTAPHGARVRRMQNRGTHITGEARRRLPGRRRVALFHSAKSRPGPPIRDRPPARARHRQVNATAQSTHRLGAHQLPAHRRTHRQVAGLDHPVVVSADVESVLPHRRKIFVVAARHAVRRHHQIRIAHISVGVADQQRTADHHLVPARQRQQQFGGLTLGRQRRTGQFGPKPDAGGEELRQGNGPRARGDGVFNQTFHTGQVGVHIGRHCLELNCGTAHEGHAATRGYGVNRIFTSSPERSAARA